MILPAYENDQAAKLGAAIKIILETNRRQCSILDIYHWIWPPIKLEQIIFIKSERFSFPIGFATWAFLTPTVSYQLRVGNLPVLQLDEWNEGAELWILDFIAPPGEVRRLAAALAATLAERHDRAYALRRSANGTVTRVRTFKPKKVIKIKAAKHPMAID